MTNAPRHEPVAIPIQQLESATVRLCGDSGDGMQLAGRQFARASARMGNAVSCLPDYPAEIRAPAGTLAGVSGFQVHLSSRPVATPADRLDVLLAMNPAALQANLKDLAFGGVLIVNSDAFQPAEWAKAGYTANPLDDGALASFKVWRVPIDALTRDAVAKINLMPREVDRCRNFVALGLMCWLFDRVTEPISRWVRTRFAGNAGAVEGNLRSLKTGYRFGEQSEWGVRFTVAKADLPSGRYCNISGIDALALGLQTSARLAGRPLVFAGTAMTPASELLHRLIERPRHDVQALQAENESAAAGVALGASFGGAIGATATSGMGMGQIAETIGLAAMTELPLVVVNVQRGGPSIGLPTKTEQGDLLQAMFGRNGECPVPVLAASTAGDGFAVAIEAARIACKFMTPVIVLTDVFLTNGSEPWRIPAVEDLPAIAAPAFDHATPFQPYARNEWLARPWEVPGTPGREHRIGGLEKEDVTGAVSYDPLNHEAMVQLRARKVARIADDIPELTIDGPDAGDLLVLGWGSTFGAIRTAVERAGRRRAKVAHAHLRYINPLPRNTGEVLKRFRRVLLPELNRGQLLTLLRSQFAIEAIGLHKVQGRPFLASEIEQAIDRYERGS